MFKSTRNMPHGDLRPADRGRGRRSTTPPPPTTTTHYYEVGPGQPPASACCGPRPSAWARWWSTRPSSSPSATWSRRSCASASWPSPTAGFFYRHPRKASYDRPPLQAPGHRLDRGAGRGHRRRRARLPRKPTTGRDNATLIVVGNFDEAQLDAWVDQYFGRLKTPAAPMPASVTAVEPPRTGPRMVDRLRAPTCRCRPWPWPGWPRPPPIRTPPPWRCWTPSCRPASRSRLYDGLVYDQKIAARDLLQRLDGNAQPGMFYVGAIIAGRQDRAARARRLR